MKSRTLTCITTMVLFAALPAPVLLAAQHHHYKLIDMGTFGGPNSSINLPIQGGSLNGRGVTVGWSATPVPVTATSNPLICGGLNGAVPFITLAFRWQNGALTDLGALPGANNCSEPTWMNAEGEIVGISENGAVDPLTGFNQARAVLWRNGEIKDLGSFGGNQNAAFGINNRGQIIGNSQNTIPDSLCFFGTTQQRAFLWEKGVIQDLGTLGGNCAYAGFINERGHIVGNSDTTTTPNPLTGVPTADPFLWENGTMIDLGTLGGAYGSANAPNTLNSHDQVIGVSSLAANPGACLTELDPNCHPFLWDKGRLIDLNTSTIGGNPLSAYAITDAGEIIGPAAFPNAPFDAFIWRNGVATDLGHLGDCYSNALAINSQGQVVGDTFVCDGSNSRAFLWENGAIVDLNTLVPPGSSLQLVDASNINNRGEIAGTGVPPGVPPANVFTEGHGFLLIPCDEKHAGIEGCDYSLVDAPAIQSSTSANPALSGRPSGMLKGLRARRVPAVALPAWQAGQRGNGRFSIDSAESSAALRSLVAVNKAKKEAT